MKKQQPSSQLTTSRKRTSSININQTRDVGILQSNLPPTAKRIKNEQLDECVTNDPVLCTSIHILPNEILDEVFSYLSIKQRIEIEKVCKRWNWMGQQLKWQWPSCLCFRITRPPLATSAIQAILFRCGKNIKKLQLLKGNNSGDIISSISRNTMEIIAQYCPNLEFINVGALRLPNLCLQTLAENCPKLKTVSLDDSIIYTETGLMDFLELCKNLECLDIRIPITGKCFSMVSPKLQILRVNSVKFKAGGLENVMNRCQYICELHLTNCFILQGIIKAFVKKYKETLNILAFGGYLCSDFYNAVHLLQNLEVLSLVNCYEVDDELVNLLTRECRNLKDLTICCSLVTDLGLRSLGSLHHLKILDISRNHGFSDVGMKHLAENRRLEELYTRCISAQSNYFVELARLCPNLRVVDMSNNPQISNVVVEAFYESITSGILKGPLKLFVGNTGVSVSAPQCDLLHLHFKISPCRYRHCNIQYDACYSVVI